MSLYDLLWPCSYSENYPQIPANNFPFAFFRSKAGSWTPIDLSAKEREFDEAAEEDAVDQMMTQSSREERSMNLEK